MTKLLKRVVPAPLRSPIRGAVFYLIPPLQRQLRRTWRRRNRLKRRIRRTRDRLNHVWSSQLKPVWLHLWLGIWDRLRRNRPDEISDQIHLINPLLGYTGGPQRTLHLFEELKNHTEVSLWSKHKVPPEIAEKYPVKRIVPWRLKFPKTGTLVIVGSLSLGPWIRYTRPRRTVVVHNNNAIRPSIFRQRLWHISDKGRRKVEVVYASELTKQLADHPGFVQASLVDIDRFVPPASRPSDYSSSARFTVGRLSSDLPYKHHPEDPALYRRLVEHHGCRVRIMGPSPSLKAELEGLLEEPVELLPIFAEEAYLFLQGLDCFFYRTSEEWLEPSGRVVTEAMACGLPVVCHDRGGYVEWIEHGRNGFLFDTQEEALQILLRLKEDRALRESVGEAARETVEELFSAAVRSEIIKFYLR